MRWTSRSRGAAKYAPEILTKAQASLDMAESALAAKGDKKQIISTGPADRTIFGGRPHSRRTTSRGRTHRHGARCCRRQGQG
jgi:hypothetical protein